MLWQNWRTMNGDTSATINSAPRTLRAYAADFWSLCKPRVVALIALTAAAGAGLAATKHAVNPAMLIPALLGITLTAASAAAFNCMVEAWLDAKMKRTQNRPLPGGRLTRAQAATFATLLGALGLSLTAHFGGALAAILTAATLFGYAVVYTMFLKNTTPQNIVIGGASGAMPPVLGWAAAAGEVGFEPLLLFLIIFVWTPPHFWALALCRQDDYARANLPMLPVTHGAKFTADMIVLYSVALLAVSMLPFAGGMSGIIYASSAMFLGARFILLSLRLRANKDDGRRLFAYSIVYMTLLFAALIIDAAVVY